MGDRMVHMKFGGNAAASVDAYLEYKRIVGEDDGGVTFTPEQYEAYKKKVLPMRMKNRLFTAWTSSTGMDCNLIGPQHNCFCEHRYHQHKTDFEKIPTERPILLPCKVKGCGCRSYHFVPKVGSCKCGGFTSSYTCGCGQPYFAHSMVVETREERLARGHPVGQDVPYQAMGGLTGFSSLAEGYMRLDPSGQGAPPDEFLNQPITSSDHPFLRVNAESIKQHKTNQRAIAARHGGQGPSQEEIDADLAERMSAMKRPGESDMDFYERRYQERQKARTRKSTGVPCIASR
ncbi:F221A-like protein [Mya arenaria]|uniref:Protein FAM221A n=1 Tax=Mya arenaria TaxID=6604 RepID=A0ABY7DCE2_MYAAR|nr:F221A-like protein [Mya arenaria]